jgi:hypothetical protein
MTRHPRLRALAILPLGAAALALFALDDLATLARRVRARLYG